MLIDRNGQIFLSAEGAFAVSCVGSGLRKVVNLCRVVSLQWGLFGRVCSSSARGSGSRQLYKND